MSRLAAPVREWLAGRLSYEGLEYDPAVFLREAVHQELKRTKHVLSWAADEGMVRGVITLATENHPRYVITDRSAGLVMAHALEIAVCITMTSRTPKGLSKRCRKELEGMRAALEMAQDLAEAEQHREQLPPSRWDF